MITLIGEAIAVILSTWKSGNSVFTNLVNVIVALVGDVPGLFGNASYSFIQKAAAGAANFEAGQAAVVDTFEIDGRQASLVALYNDGAAGAALGLS